MATGMVGSVYDPEEEAIRRQLAQADMLRKLGAEGNTGAGYHGGKVFIVGNPLGNIASSIAGAYVGDRAAGQQQQLADTRAKEYDDFIGKRPSTFTEQPSMQEQVGPPMEGAGPLPQVATGPNERVLKGATQMLDEQNKWMGEIGPTTNPLLKSIQQQSVTNDLGWPEKMIALEQANALKKQLAAEKAAAQKMHDESIAAQKASAAATAESGKALDRAIRQQTANAATTNAANNSARTAETVANARAKRDEAVKKKDEIKVAFAGGLDRLETMVNDVMKTPNLNSAVGPVQGAESRFAPVTMSPFDRSTAIVKIDALKEYLQSKGLEDLRKAGVAPGSVTEKEWSKFAVRLANINRLLPEADFKKELDGLLKDVADSRARLNVGQLDEPVSPEGGTAPAAPAARGPRTVVSKHKIVRGSNAGKTGVLWSNGDRTLE